MFHGLRTRAVIHLATVRSYHLHILLQMFHSSVKDLLLFRIRQRKIIDARVRKTFNRLLQPHIAILDQFCRQCIVSLPARNAKLRPRMRRMTLVEIRTFPYVRERPRRILELQIQPSRIEHGRLVRQTLLARRHQKVVQRSRFVDVVIRETERQGAGDVAFVIVFQARVVGFVVVALGSIVGEGVPYQDGGDFVARVVHGFGHLVECLGFAISKAVGYRVPVLGLL
mmetsp:Transcript_9401/g.19822  ORF Transcript_9401/g.19822 Transcript_9401/m.19822 type:complete len:226 (+) Transcript_9401:421-1098(+)